MKKDSAHKPKQSELEARVAEAEAKAMEVDRTAPTGDRELHANRERASAIAMDAFAPREKALTQLDGLKSEHDAKLRQLVDDAKRRAIGRSAEAVERLDALVKAERAGLRALPTDWRNPWVPSWPPVYFIRSTPGGSLRDTHIEEANTWAKWQCTTPGISGGTEKLSFYHLWENTEDALVLADIFVRLNLAGHCECSAEGMGVPAGWFWSTQSDLDVSARLTVLPLWTPDAPPPLHTVPITRLDATAGVFGDSEVATVQTTMLLSTRRFAVPAGAFILIEASLAVDHSGSVDVDFASGEFRVSCPYCFVIVPAPQMNVNP